MPMDKKTRKKLARNLGSYCITEVSNSQPELLSSYEENSYEDKRLFKRPVKNPKKSNKKLDKFLWEKKNESDKFDSEVFSEKGIKPKKFVSPNVGGEDMAEFHVEFEWNNWERLEFYLEKAQNEAQSGENGYIEIKGLGLIVSPKGIRIGSAQGNYYHYELYHRGFKIAIRKSSQPEKKQRFNGYVRIGSIPLMYWNGLKPAYKIFKKTIRKLGGRVVKTLVSRVDLCVDLANERVETFSDLFLKNAYAARGKFWAIYGKGTKITGFTLGKSDIVCRIYNKLEEVLKNPIKHAILKKRRWGSQEVLCASRVEFQLRRGYWHKKKVNSIKDYFNLRAKTIKYLTHDWFRMFDQKVDKTNKTRDGKSGKVWTNVIEHFKLWCGVCEEAPPTKPIREDKITSDNSRLKKQALGCILSFLTLDHEWEKMDFKEISMKVFEQIGEVLKGEEMEKKVKKKFKERSTQFPFILNT